MRRGRRASLLVALLGAAGCFNYAQDHCASCAIIDERSTRLPPLADARALVVLVPGAFGFGDEWAPVVARLRARPRLGFFVFAWPGPWRDPSRAARRLEVVLQTAVDRAPTTVREVLVLAHSAGGLIASYAVRRLVVPAGRHVMLASIAAPPGPSVAPFHAERAVNTPLGVSVGGTQEREPPSPPRVAIVEYFTADDPAPAAAHDPARVFLGARVGHDASVALVALPLIDALIQ